MATHLQINSRLQIPMKELHFDFVRSQGPGGQNVNKVNSKVVLRWNVARNASLPVSVRERLASKFPRRISREGDLILTSQRYRDQGRNLTDCLEKLKTLVTQAAHVPRPRKATKPTAGSRVRRRREKETQSQKKQSRRVTPNASQ
jgi:ribosome-associated protein